MKTHLPLFLVIVLLVVNCSRDDEVPTPVACFTMDKSVCVIGDCPIDFDAGCSEDEVYYLWDFEDDGIVDEEGTNKAKVSHTYATVGAKTVRLTVRGENKVTASTSKTIQVEELEYTLKAFSGNNQDGVLGYVLPQPIVVRLVNQLNNGPGKPVQINFVVVSGGGLITESVLTDANGLAEVIWKLGDECGEQTAEASVHPDEELSVEPLALSAIGKVIFYEGKFYPVVQIGDRCWMAKNLNHAMGDSWLYPQDRYPPEIPYNPDLYGRLYNWETAMVACPDGWHLPTRTEWDQLIQLFDPDWTSSSNIPQEHLIAGGSSGFEAVLGGYAFSSGNGYNYLGSQGNYWSSTESIMNDYAWTYRFTTTSIILNEGYASGAVYGYSCRCIKD
jgi:uncharacterized protein (TIGR02145 family)